MRSKPNIVLITSDQHRADALGCEGHPCVRTPHLDKLAQMGTRFTQAYADCPVCIPARTTLITGIQAHVYGMPSYNEHYRIERPREQFLGSLMTKAGYQTCLIGKSHWHTDPSFRAGFETFIDLEKWRNSVHRRAGRSFSAEGMGWNELFPAPSYLPPELYETNWTVDECLDFLDYRDRTQPFFLWASFQDPHPPNVIHEPYYSMYDNSAIPEPVIPDWIGSEDEPLTLLRHRMAWNSVPMKPDELKKARGVYYGKITNLDHQLGRLLGKLQSEQLLQNTYIIYTSDHGEMLGDAHDCGKSTFLQGAARIPMIVCPPSSGEPEPEPGQVADAIVGWDDLLPTICQAAGTDAPSDITGKSMLPLIMGGQSSIRDSYHGQIEESHMFLKGRYKYLYFVEDGKELLFDTRHDPYDRNNLAAARPELLSDMKASFAQHLLEEGNAHYSGGQLLNKRNSPPPSRRMKAQNAYGWH